MEPVPESRYIRMAENLSIIGYKTSREITPGRNSGPSELGAGMSSKSDISGVLRKINGVLAVE